MHVLFYKWAKYLYIHWRNICIFFDAGLIILASSDILQMLMQYCYIVIYYELLAKNVTGYQTHQCHPVTVYEGTKVVQLELFPDLSNGQVLCLTDFLRTLETLSQIYLFL